MLSAKQGNRAIPPIPTQAAQQSEKQHEPQGMGLTAFATRVSDRF
jgi:hypothetical protein